MSKLQRSTVSFRRQGSSGRIWDDPLRAMELHDGAATTPTSAPQVPSGPEFGIDATAGISPPPQESPAKKQPEGRGFSALLCMCPGPRPAQ